MSLDESDTSSTDIIYQGILGVKEKLYPLLPPIPKNLRFNEIILHQYEQYVK